MHNGFGWIGYLLDTVGFVVDHWIAFAAAGVGVGAYWLGRRR